ncbi:MAG: creatininase family protein, partial [Ferrovum sp.]|nr:creatininase family protein [Ferrovum sp.]
IPEAAFEALLEGAARSFKQHGFRDIVLLGDHGGYQKSIARVAAKLNREWAADPACRVHALSDYYRASQNAFAAMLKRRGYSETDIGTHAGLADTSLALALDKTLVRSDALAHAAKPGLPDGVYGDPRQASADLGQQGVEQIVVTSVQAIQALTRAPR